MFVPESILKRFLFISVLLFACIANAFTVAVVPQFTATVTEKNWSPVIKELERTSGVPLTLMYYKSIGEFEKGLKKGEIDFAYMNPYHAVMFKKHYRPIVKDGKQKLTGILLVAADSKYKNVKEQSIQSVVEEVRVPDLGAEKDVDLIDVMIHGCVHTDGV